MSEVQVSIIIPVYNVASYIERCILSVMEQDCNVSLECILVDDGSEDDGLEIAQRLFNEYDGTIRFQIVKHLQNRGLSAARNTGIENANGKYVFFLDADDYIDSDCISSMIDSADHYKNVEMVQGGAIAHGGEPKPWMSMINSRLPEFIEGNAAIERVMLDRSLIPVTAWNRLVLRHFIIDNDLYFEEGIIHEDELWTFRLSLSLNSLTILKKDMYHYMQRDNGIMGKEIEKKGESFQKIVEKMEASLNASNSKVVVPYIIGFIQLRSFDIQDEMERRSFLSLIHGLDSWISCFKRIELRIWVNIAQQNIRNHYWLYSLLYHWRIR